MVLAAKAAFGAVAMRVTPTQIAIVAAIGIDAVIENLSAGATSTERADAPAVVLG